MLTPVGIIVPGKQHPDDTQQTLKRSLLTGREVSKGRVSDTDL